jgi:hypothetical protein
MNWLFPISITGLSVAAAYWLGHVFAAETPAHAVGYASWGADRAGPSRALVHGAPPAGRKTVALDAPGPSNANPSHHDKRGSPMNFDKLFQAQLDQLKEEGNYRIFAELQRKCGDFPKVRNHSDGQDEVTVWCSNDYLGMGHHPKVIEAMRSTVAECGTGAGGTRNISGNAWHHKQLEAELADLHNKEDALLFTSGYVSNWAALSTLGSRLPNAVILSDELNHASMIEGIRHARCQKVIWKHNDPEDLDRKLAALPANATKIVAFESVYSWMAISRPSRRSSTSATSMGRCPISTRSTRSACMAPVAAVSRNARG